VWTGLEKSDTDQKSTSKYKLLQIYVFMYYTTTVNNDQSTLS